MSKKNVTGTQQLKLYNTRSQYTDVDDTIVKVQQQTLKEKRDFDKKLNGFIDRQHKEIAEARLSLYEGTAKEIARSIQRTEEEAADDN